MLRIVLLCWLFAGTSVLNAQGKAVDVLLQNKHLSNASIGLSVKNVADGTVVAAYRPELSLHPASLTKLLTTVMVLHEKGEYYRYVSLLSYSGCVKEGTLHGDLILEFSGDPCFDSRYFPDYSLLRMVTDAMRSVGIRRVEGVVRMESRMLSADIPGSWLWEDVGNYYAANHFPFNYRDNSYELVFKSGRIGTPTELLSVSPVLPGMGFVNRVTATGNNRDDAWIYGGPYADTLYIKGSIPANRTSFAIRGSMPRPDLCFLQELKTLLRKEGVEIAEKKMVDLPRTLLLKMQSPTVGEIVYYTNKKSVNLFAEALGKLADFSTGASRFLASIPTDTTGVALKDASGLSVFNVAPASVFADLLVWAHHNLGDAFVRSLPVSGVDAGLNAYCNSFPVLKNNVKAKTGSFSGVRCLSGYLTARSGKLLAFSIQINHYTCNYTEVCRAIGEFLDGLYRDQ